MWEKKMKSSWPQQVPGLLLKYKKILFSKKKVGFDGAYSFL